MSNFISLNRKKIFFGSVIAISLVISGVVFVSAQSVAAETSRRVRAVFSSSIPLPEFTTIAKQYGIMPTELYFAQGETGGGYTPKPGENLNEIAARFQTEHQKFLRVAMENTEEGLAQAKNDVETNRLSVLYDQLKSAKFQTDSEGIEVNSIEMRDNPAFIEELNRRGLIEKVINTELTIKQKIKLSVTEVLHGLGRTFGSLVNTAYASLWHESWAPYGGGSSVNQSYTYQTFYFNNLSNFTSWNAYEHETQVYDPNFANYAGYWNSNMPNKYYDTQFLDNENIDNFTVGSTNPIAMSTYYQYYTYMSLSAGSASTATVRIKGQKGQKAYPSCHGWTWCVLYPLATTGSMATFTAPAGMSWQY